MKTLFIETKKLKFQEPEGIENLPKKLHIIYTIQYKNLAENIKKKLQKNKHKIADFEQVLGCSKIKPKAELLLIGSGRFHALQIAFRTGKQVIIYENNKISKITNQEIDKFKGKQKAKIAKFYASDNIMLLVSTKSGQNQLKKAVKEKQKLEKKFKEKNFYILLADNLNPAELENFPADLYLNFACPGLEYDSPKILNFSSLSL